MFRHPLPSTGSLRVGSPASQVLRGAPTPCRPSRRTSFPSLGGTAPALDVRSQGSRALLPGPGLVQRVAHPAPRARRRQGLSGSWGTPMCTCPALRPRRDLHARPTSASRCCLPSCLTTSALAAIVLRGSITRPAHSLSSRFAGRITPPPRNTRFRLVASLCRAGLTARWVPARGFRACQSHLIPLPQALPDALGATKHRFVSMKTGCPSATAIRFAEDHGVIREGAPSEGGAARWQRTTWDWTFTASRARL